MSAFVDFFLQQHDPRFVGLAAIVCLVAAYACVSLLRHARRATGRMHVIWIGVAALAVGLGIWATHFIGMLALRPGFTLSYDLLLTGASLLIAIGICGVGIAMAARGQSVADQFLGGAVVGIAISCMHYTGIAALVMGGAIGWNTGMIALSVIAGMLLGGLSFVAAMNGRMLTGALLLTLAICAMHFTAMGAADFSRCFPLSAGGEINSGWLSGGVALISLLVLGAAFGSVLLDEADRRRTQREKERQEADAARINEVTSLLELATTHMAQGLCLFDNTGHLRFHNQPATDLIRAQGIGDDAVGGHFRDLSLAMQGASRPNTTAEQQEAETRIDELIAGIARGEVKDYLRTLDDGRIVRFVHRPIADGGWVTTIDDVTDEQRSQAAISHLAYHDPLTNILNRAAFNEQLDHALHTAGETDQNFAVIAVDLDRFKEINDTYGHQVGDQVLKALATRLSTGLKEGEVVARLGGDEFAALKMFTSMDALRDFIARIESALFTRIETDVVTVNSSASIGVAIFPEDGGDRSRLLNNADLAMYRAKAEFDRRTCYYEHDMDEHARQRRAMAKDLWTALETNGFSLVYQVQKSVATDEITGYEVLLRWSRPGHGMVSPADFIPVAEECGAITAIGTWVLRTACRNAASWPEKRKIAVNVSGVQLGSLDLIDTVRDVLTETGLSPSLLELEVTETSIIADKQRALHILRQIKAMGVSIAIDDFGTGYSSLDTLRSFPFDKIKIDRSFMTEVDHDEQSKAIVRAILALGRSLSVPVLAEGVETCAQLEVLRVEGCSEAQGFLLGRPGEIDWEDLIEPMLGQMVV
ncbi:EAL domain-containing protein [Devosia neptuniae]|uniref:bifunctional diguanylate cyclase/phosphodiesterase n=1 Tax=Devosia TaxID=46913 RepID=UPI0022B0233A|nr:EAL domain-containing protein [Devosia neptuniae]MCZ4344774.1 EAL domain-containing protein [Devosia neptuniae]